MPQTLMTVQEAGRYLRLNARSVYLLAQRGAIPATRVTGKWLFPQSLLDEWIESSARRRSGTPPGRGPTTPADSVFAAGGDDPALDALPAVLRGMRGAPVLFIATVGSTEGLRLLGEGRADVAWAHLLDPSTGEYNVTHVRGHLGNRPAVLVTLFHRELGLVTWTGNPKRLTGLGDLGRPGLRFAGRQPGSATRQFVEASLVAAGLNPRLAQGPGEPATTHWAVGLRVLRGEADVGVAPRAVAQGLSLGWVPLTRERFDLVIPKDGFFRPPVQTLLEAVRSPAFRQELDRRGGYAAEETGRVAAEVG
jgi:putative molybdopterin biosynthesis protein